MGNLSLPTADLSARLYLALLKAAGQPNLLLAKPNEAIWTAELLSLVRDAAPARSTKSPSQALEWVATEIHVFLLEAGRRMGLNLAGIHVQSRIDGGWQDD